MVTEQTRLLIADIGGYTRFMTVHRINLAHAHYMISRLMEALIDSLGRGWRLAKLEGDAAFVYKRVSAKAADEAIHIDDQVRAMIASFRRRQRDLRDQRICNCDGCVQVGDLTIKFVAHEGEVAFRKIKRNVELAGVDVILVHRLLKNSVPIVEYLLMSERVHAQLEAGVRDGATALDEKLEGLGQVTTYYVDVADLGAATPAPAARSPIPALWQWLAMTVRSIPLFIGVRKPRIGAANRLAIEGRAPSLKPSAPGGGDEL